MFKGVCEACLAADSRCGDFVSRAAFAIAGTWRPRDGQDKLQTRAVRYALTKSFGRGRLAPCCFVAVPASKHPAVSCELSGGLNADAACSFQSQPPELQLLDSSALSNDKRMARLSPCCAVPLLRPCRIRIPESERRHRLHRRSNGNGFMRMQISEQRLCDLHGTTCPEEKENGKGSVDCEESCRAIRFESVS